MNFKFHISLHFNMLYSYLNYNAVHDEVFRVLQINSFNLINCYIQAYYNIPLKRFVRDKLNCKKLYEILLKTLCDKKNNLSSSISFLYVTGVRKNAMQLR